MSLAETKELMSTMKELMLLLNNVQTKTEQIASDMPRTKTALSTFRQLERITLRFLAIGQRMGLPENIDAAIRKVMQLISAVNALTMSINMMMMSNPYTAVLGIAGFMGSVFTMGSVLEGY